MRCKNQVLFVLISLIFIQFSSAVLVEISANQAGDYRDGYIRDDLVLTSGSSVLQVGDDGFFYYHRSFIDFNTAVIPNDATINSIDLQLTRSGANNQGTIIVYGLNQTSTKFSNAQLLAVCGGGAGSTTYNTGTTIFQGTGAGTQKNITMNSAGIQNLTAQLGQDFFSVCLRVQDDNLLNGVETDFHSNESATEAYRPRLFIDYTPAADTTAPIVVINTPLNRTYNTSEFPVNFNVALNEAGSVMFSLDNGVTNTSMTPNASATGFTYSQSALANGSYLFSVYANDTAGNPNNTASVWFSVYNDTIIPSVSWLNISLLNPNSNINVTYGQFFQFSVNVSCSGNNGTCGQINASLDPAPIGYAAADIELKEKKGILAKIAEFFKNIFRRITGMAIGELVNTTIGANPFYTNMSNPLDKNSFSCLDNLINGTSCEVYWWVNATNQSGTYEFYAFANSTNYSSMSAVSQRINITINYTAPLENIPPFFSFADDHLTDYDSPDPQEPNKNLTIIVNVTDLNSTISEVIFNISCASTKRVLYYSKGNISRYDNDIYYGYFAPSVSDFGTCNYTIWANDSANNPNQTASNFSVVDLWAPEISNISASPFVLNGPGDIEYLNISVTDDFTIDRVWVIITLPSGVEQKYYLSNTSAANYNSSFTAPVLRGKYKAVFYANDSFGNTENTLDNPFYFHVPPYIVTDREIYSLGQIVQIRGIGFSSSGLDIVLNITNSTSSVAGFPVNVATDGSNRIYYNWTIPQNMSGQEGQYNISAYDSGYNVNVYADFELKEYYKEYQNGTIIIPMDRKQSTNINDFDFLRAYGLIWRLVNDSYGVDMVFTPPCQKLNATDINTSRKYYEYYCNGFFLIDNSSAWAALSAYRALPQFSGIVVHNLSDTARIKQTQIMQITKAPRIALWNKGEEIITQTLSTSQIPYSLINITQVLNNGLNTSAFDIFLVGHYDFIYYVNRTSPSNYQNLISKISAFINDSGDMHAECIGVDSLDKGGSFIGNILRGPAESGNIRFSTTAHQIIQTHANTTKNIGGTTPTLNVTNTASGINILAVDNRWTYSDFSHIQGRNEIAKLISKDIGSGYISYGGGHLGEVNYSCSCAEDCSNCVVTTQYAVPRNRILDNLVFFGSYVNDETPPAINAMQLNPSAGANITQFRNLWLSALVSDNALIDTINVWAVISFGSSAQTITMNGPYYPLNFTASFENTSYVVDKSTNTRYNVTFYANDSDGNIANSTTYFFVVPDQYPRWSSAINSTPLAYNSSAESVFNISWIDDFGFSNVTFESNFSGSPRNYTFSSSAGNATSKNYSYSAIMPAGTYYWKAYATDEYNQTNSSSSFVFSIAKASSSLNLTLAGVQGNYSATTGASVLISASFISGAGNVSIYGNNALLTSGNAPLSTTISYSSAGTYNITAIFGENQNYTASSETYYLILSDSGGGGGGGGGGDDCIDSSWTCTEWGECTGGTKTRSCTSNCGSSKTDASSCTICENECSSEGTSCSGNNVVVCSFVNGCFKIISSNSCEDSKKCSDGQCILLKEPEKVYNEPQFSPSSGFGGSIIPIKKPSDFIPHGDIPDVVVDAGAAGVAVVAVGGISWWIFLWLVWLFLPLLALKLRHYSISIFDAENKLEMFEDNKLDVSRLESFIILFEREFGKLHFAEKTNEVLKFNCERGFLEIRLDAPFIVTGHFTRKQEADKFEESLISTFKKFNCPKVNIVRSLEKASIIRVLRAYLRKKRTEKQLQKLFQNAKQ